MQKNKRTDKRTDEWTNWAKFIEYFEWIKINLTLKYSSFLQKKGHARVKSLCFSMLHLATFGYKHLQYIFAHFMKHTKQKTTIKTTNKHPNKLIWVTKKAVKESNVIIMSQRKAYLEPYQIKQLRWSCKSRFCQKNSVADVW